MLLYVLLSLRTAAAAAQLSLQWTSARDAAFLPVDAYGGECSGLLGKPDPHSAQCEGGAVRLLHAASSAADGDAAVARFELGSSMLAGPSPWERQGMNMTTQLWDRLSVSVVNLGVKDFYAGASCS